MLDALDAELPIGPIVDFLSKERDGARIFVHCNAGVSRYRTDYLTFAGSKIDLL